MLLQEPIKKVVNNLFDCKLKFFFQRTESLLNEPIWHDQDYNAPMQLGHLPFALTCELVRFNSVLKYCIIKETCYNVRIRIMMPVCKMVSVGYLNRTGSWGA